MKIEQFKQLKVGDKVRIVGKKDGDCWNSSGEMDKWLGKIMTVRSVCFNYVGMEEDRNDGSSWCWYPHMIAEKVKAQEIHITVDGNKTIAVLKENGKVVKRAEAKCNVGDTFDFETGAEIALKRVFGNDVKVSDDGKVMLYRKCGVKEVERKAKVGEYIKIVKPICAEDTYEKGDILKVYKVDPDGGYVVFCETEKKVGKHSHIRNHKGNCAICDNEYVVLEGYTPPEKEEEKPEFKPHLLSGRTHYGVIGEPTKYKDAIGRPLFIGDTVEHFDTFNNNYGETPIVCNNGESFVMGIYGACDDKTGEIKDGWKIIKKRSFNEVKDGEKTYCGVTYIKTEKE